MNSYKRSRSSACQDHSRSKVSYGNRRSSAARDQAVATGRRCSLSTFTSTSRIRSNSKGFVGRDYSDADVEQCQPPMEDMPRIPGYEDVTFEPSIVSPPSGSAEQENTLEDRPNAEPIKQSSLPTEKEAREILLRHAASKCSYDKSAAREMVITNIEHRPGYKYTLESFTESRQLAWSFEPYTGGPLDEPIAGDAPDPWLISCSAPAAFQNQSTILDVPHTDAVKICHACGGVGSKRCTACSAAGWERCSFCLGDGHKTSLQGHRERCYLCLGTGRKKCWKCCGDTIAACSGCAGTGQIRCFIAITITWSNHVDNCVIEPPEAAAIGKKLEMASGNVAFEAENKLVSPVSDFPDSPIPSVSASLLEKHNSDFTTQEKIIMQRHSVRAIPVHCVTYEWRQQVGRFFIFGTQNEVFAPGYPRTICCCAVM